MNADSPHRERRVRRGLVLSLAAAALWAAAGCQTPAAESAKGTDPNESPAVVGSRNGLEVRWWVVDEAFSDVGSVLGNYAAPTDDLGLKALGVWYASGLRVVAVPVEDLENVERLLPPVEVVSTTWLGQPGEWSELVRGARFGSEKSVRVAGSYVRLGAGTPRLLARAWMIPVADGTGMGGAKAALRIEVRAQHEQAREGEPEFSARVTPPGVREMGVEFQRLALEGTLRRGMAYVIACEEPGVEWKPGALDRATPGRREYVLELHGEELGEDEQGAGAVGKVERLGERGGDGSDGNVDADGTRSADGTGTVESDRARSASSGSAPARTMEGRKEIGPEEAVGGARGLVGDEEAESWGEAMLRARGIREDLGSGRTRVRAARAVVVLIPRVPERFELLRR